MDINRDEVRRRLSDARRAQAEALPRWRAVIDRSIHPEDPSDASVREARTAAILNVPTRRGFLRIGGVTVAGAAIVAACTPEPHTVQLAQTGTTPTTVKAPTYEPIGDIATDVTLLRVAQSIEKLAVAAYDAASGSDVLPEAVADAAKLFRDQHDEHYGLLAGKVSEIGGESYTEPNPELFTTVVKPVADTIADGTATLSSILELAIALEDAAAQTYVNACSLLTSADLRQALMSIGGVEARHVAVLLGVRTPDNPSVQIPFSFGKTAGAVKPRSDAYVAVGSGADVPESTTSTRAVTTTTTARPGGSTPGSSVGGSSTTR